MQQINLRKTQREENITLASKLKGLVATVKSKQKGWKDEVKAAEEELPEEITEALYILGKTKSVKSEAYQDSLKLLNARVNNLESNLHIEIDMERIEDRSKALSYIGIEVADEQEELKAYTQETTFERKPSLWQRFKNSKLARAVTYVFRIRIRIELPNALPEGRGENY